MPEEATTLTAHLHHYHFFPLASPSSYAYHEVESSRGCASLHTVLRKSKDSLLSRPKAPKHVGELLDQNRQCLFSASSEVILILTAAFLLERRARITFFGSTKREQNRIWQWFFGSITDSRPRPLASTPVDLSSFHPLVIR